MYIKRTAHKLIQKFNTRNPFQICEELGYIVLRVPLVGLRGFYQYIERQHIIYIKDTLDDQESKLVCAHELGHSLLHTDNNHFFMNSHTYFSLSKFELEADKFAADLLYSDQFLQDYLSYSIQTVAECLGLSQQVVEYRFSSVQPKHTCEF